jgi:hypothetical protein
MATEQELLLDPEHYHLLAGMLDWDRTPRVYAEVSNMCSLAAMPGNAEITENNFQAYRLRLEELVEDGICTIDGDEARLTTAGRLLAVTVEGLLREINKLQGTTPEGDGWACGVCHDPDSELYMVHNEVWKAAKADKADKLCWKCLSGRLGRPLRQSDFDDSLCNLQTPTREKIEELPA